MAEVEITFKLKDEVVRDQLVAAICAKHGYQPTLGPERTPNPITPGQFATNHIVEYCAGIMREYAANVATDEAKSEAEAAVNAMLADAVSVQVQ